MPVGVLKVATVGRHLDLGKASAWVSAATGRGAFRQGREIIALARGPGRLTPQDYYLYALYRDDLTASEKRAFLSHRAGTALNLRLSPRGPRGMHALFTDKLIAGFVLDRAGFPTPRPLAFFARHLAAPGVRRLRTVGDIVEFLTSEGALPCFGKANDAQASFGAVRYDALQDGGRRLVLGNGTVVETQALAEEIAREFPEGYLFQDLIRQHPQVTALTGPAASLLRVVTLRGPDGPEPLFAALKLPAKGAMHDVLDQNPGTGVALVDLADGRLLRAQDLDRMGVRALELAPATGAALAGAAVPLVPEAVDLACRVQEMFPGHGVIGHDIALTPEGPQMVEVNWNPGYHQYQRPADRGLMNPDFAPRIAAALAETERLGAVWQKAGRVRRRRWLWGGH